MPKPLIYHHFNPMAQKNVRTLNRSLAAGLHFSALRFLTLIIIFLPYVAYANNTDTQIGSVLCTVTGWMQGNAGKGLEIIILSILGIGALLGKVSWSKALIEGVAVAALFGAAQIVESLNAGAILGCATTGF